MKRYLALSVALILLASCDRPNRGGREVPKTEPITYTNIESRESRSMGPTTVRMTPMGGVYEVPIEINGVDMNFIFDTGASSISISETEVFFLIKQGKLDETDVLGSVQFQDATGRISEGTMINLRTVKIGDRVMNNVEASVVHNSEAPLLLGQSALAQFGKVTIDYKKNLLSLE